MAIQSNSSILTAKTVLYPYWTQFVVLVVSLPMWTAGRPTSSANSSKNDERMFEERYDSYSS